MRIYTCSLVVAAVFVYFCFIDNYYNMSSEQKGNNLCAALREMSLQKASHTTTDVNVSTYKCCNLILANVRPKLKRGETKSKQSKAWNISRWPPNGKQVSLVAK